MDVVYLPTDNAQLKSRSLTVPARFERKHPMKCVLHAIRYTKQAPPVWSHCATHCKAERRTVCTTILSPFTATHPAAK